MSALGLLNTRPMGQNVELTRLVEQAGFAVVECPALQIETQMLNHCPHWSDQDVWVFVSRNAVTHFAKQAAGVSGAVDTSAKLIAVGAGTAQAIAAHGWPNLQPVAERFDSEGMLTLDILAKPAGLRVGIVCGDGGRDLLARTLQQQGAKVKFYEVYQRANAPFCNQAWQQFRGFQQPVFLFTSQTGLTALFNQLDEVQRKWSQKQPMIVFSQRIKDFARQQGCVGPIVITRNASDQAVLERLISLDNSSGDKHE